VFISIIVNIALLEYSCAIHEQCVVGRLVFLCIYLCLCSIPRCLCCYCPWNCWSMYTVWWKSRKTRQRIRTAPTCVRTSVRHNYCQWRHRRNHWWTGKGNGPSALNATMGACCMGILNFKRKYTTLLTLHKIFQIYIIQIEPNNIYSRDEFLLFYSPGETTLRCALKIHMHLSQLVAWQKYF
jgi:hypothetical protein